MNSAIKLAPFILTIVVSISCQPGQPESPNMMDQVLGAMQVPGQKERDAALANACRECAAEGDVESVLMGIPRIEDKAMHDKVARECVSKLQTAERNDAALKVAELISDPAIRDELLKSLTTDRDFRSL